MKDKDKKVVYEEIHQDDRGNETSFREVLIERLKIESYFSPGEIRFIETSNSSN